MVSAVEAAALEQDGSSRPEEPAELVDGSVSVGGGLKVGEKVLGAVAAFEQFDAAPNLLAHRNAGLATIGAEAAIVAIDAAADRHRAVDVWTGKAGVHGDTKDFLAKAFPQKAAERIIATLRRHPRSSFGIM